MKTSKYKCVVCNKMISRKPRQWKSNHLRYQTARICPECLREKIDKLWNAKADYNHYHRLMYPTRRYF